VHIWTVKAEDLLCSIVCLLMKSIMLQLGEEVWCEH